MDKVAIAKELVKLSKELAASPESKAITTSLDAAKKSVGTALNAIKSVMKGNDVLEWNHGRLKEVALDIDRIINDVENESGL